MQCFAPVCVLLFLLASAASPALLAQFREPTPEELKMTDDPKAPGAAAVYLDIEETTDDPTHFHRFYARIKVLAEKGKELATVEVPFRHGIFKVTDIKGRTIHSDGSIVPLTGKPEDLLAHKTSRFEIDKEVFTLPSVEIGSILEYRYEVHYPDNWNSPPDWELQHPYFVHREHFSFTPFPEFLTGVKNSISRVMIDQHGNAINSLIWWPQLPPGADVKTDTIGRFSLDVADIPAIAREEWMPPDSSVLYHVLFYYKSSFSSGDFWASEAKRWSKGVDHFAEATRPIKEAVAGLVSPGDSDLDKAKKLYKAVQSLDNTDFSRKKSESEIHQLGLHETHRAEDTWAQKSGSREDIVLLYLAMLRAAGLTAYDMKVVNRDRAIFAPAYLSFDQMDDDVIVLSLSGKDILLDPGEKMCPFQMVHWKHTGAGGVRQSPDGRSAATSPLQPYTANTLTRIGDVYLDDHGAVTGTIRFIMAGQTALHYRQQALRMDEDEAKKSFDRFLKSITAKGIEATIDRFNDLGNPDVSLVAVVKVQGSPGASTARRILLPGYLFEPANRHPFINQTKRQLPVDMRYAEQITDQVTFHLPHSLSVEAAPQESKIPWADRAVLATRVKSDPGQIVIARQFARSFVLVKPEDYATLADFYRKMAAADDQQLVLIAASPAQANQPAR